MLINTIIALVVLAFIASVLWWALQRFMPVPKLPEVRGYDGLAPGPVPPVNELVHDDVPLQSIISTDPRRELFEALLETDSNLAKLGHSDADRAKLIDQPFGDKVFRAKKAEPTNEQ